MLDSTPRPLPCDHCGSPPRPFPGEPECPECRSEPVKCFWRLTPSCTKVATERLEGEPCCRECAMTAERDAQLDTERAPALVCGYCLAGDAVAEIAGRAACGSCCDAPREATPSADSVPPPAHDGMVLP